MKRFAIITFSAIVVGWILGLAGLYLAMDLEWIKDTTYVFAKAR